MLTKTGILNVSLTLIVIATTLGVFNATYSSGSETVARLGLVSFILGLGAVGSFFVGLAYPTASVSNTVYDGNIAQTTKVVNK